jgi:hypothetical protein
MTTRLVSGQARRILLVGVLVAAAAPPPALRAQRVEITVQGGIHAIGLDRPERALVRPGGSAGLESVPGGATALGLRVGAPLAGRWLWDVGLVWSRNRNLLGSIGRAAPALETHTLFTSTTLRARLTSPRLPFGLSAGAGPAFVLHQGNGSSLLARQADLGAVLSLAGAVRLDPRLGFRLDAQQYLFSSTFRDSYAPPFVSALVEPAGPRFRHEFVLLAGLFWQAF